MNSMMITCPRCSGTCQVLVGGSDPERDSLIPCDHMDCEDGEIEVEASEVERLMIAAKAHLMWDNTATETELRRALIAIGGGA